MTTAEASRSIRNIAVIAHGGAGKTTLLESLLYLAGAIPSKGAVEKGKAAMLTEPEEIQHHFAITIHVGHVLWKDTAIHFIDTPGDFNFLENTRGVLPAIDGVVFLFSGIEGVKPETDRLWKMVEAEGIPVIGFVNQMDDAQADLARAMTAIEKHLRRPVEPLAYPLRRGSDLIGVVDLLREKALTVTSGKIAEASIPDGMRDDLARARTHLIERIVEHDDGLLEAYLGGTELSNDELLATMKKAVLKRDFIPILSGAGQRDLGVSLLLDYIVDCLPSPKERDENRPIVGSDPGDKEATRTRECSAAAPFSARVVKTTIDPFFGKLSIVRVFSGEVTNNMQLVNSSRGVRQKAGHLYLLQGKELEQVEKLSAGEIGAIAKLDETHTGESLSDVDHPICFPSVEFAAPPVAYAVHVDVKNDEKVSSALVKLADEDPSLHFYRDEQTHQMILAGMGQAHIDVTMERLERKFGAHADLKIPTVPYRETIKGTAKVQGKLKKQTGGHGQFANTWLEVSPLPRGRGLEFIDAIVGGVIPKQYVPSVKKGVIDAAQKGPLGGFPVVDLAVKLYDGSYHDVDSSDYAFQVAGSIGLKAALESAQPVLLEPIVSMRILVPEEFAGTIMKDINGRRGHVTGYEGQGEELEILAELPLAEVLEYGQQLGGMTSGRGTYTMHVASYREVPPAVSDKVLKAYRGDQKAAG